MGWFLIGYAESKEEERENQRVAWLVTSEKKEKPEMKEKKTKSRSKKNKK